MGVFGIAGSLFRYTLESNFNEKYPNFPLGTFVANSFGSYLLALLTLLSKFIVSYHNINAQSILFGLSTGFCGCLTTISGFVNQIRIIPQGKSYIYSLASYIVAQIGFILILNIEVYQKVPRESIFIPPIDFGNYFEAHCLELLKLGNCPY